MFLFAINSQVGKNNFEVVSVKSFGWLLKLIFFFTLMNKWILTLQYFFQYKIFGKLNRFMDLILCFDKG
jgi:hypothetical protein